MRRGVSNSSTPVLNVFVREDENWMLLTWGDVSHLAPGAASEGDDP